MMNIDQLRVFLSVARHLHFSRAGDELFITQPAVSASVAKLETQYGVKLFHRIGRRVELTDAGRYLRIEGTRLLERVDLVERGLQDFNALKRGVLSLGASLTVGNYWLPNRLKAFCDRHAGIDLRCQLANAEQVLEGTAQGQYDLCFVTGSSTPSAPEAHLTAEEVGRDCLEVVVGRDHPWFGRAEVEPSDLLTTTWIIREKGSGAQQLLETLLAEACVDPTALRVTLVLNSSEMVKAVALGGGAAAALPETMVLQEVAMGLLWPVAIAGCPRKDQPIWMVRHTQRYDSQLLRAFEDLVRAMADGANWAPFHPPQLGGTGPETGFS
jgi:DNA-binding transcriptional LysR family regulator